MLEKLYDYHTDFIRRSSEIEYSIKSFQNRLLIYQEPQTDYKVSLSKIECPYVNGMLSREYEPIKIALVPLTGKLDYLEFHEIGNKFFLEKLNYEEQYKQKVMDILDKLALEKANIVIFPEMVFSDYILNSVKKYLNENKGRFSLIIAGTIWKNKKNECVILSGDGIELTRQLKLNPYHKTPNLQNEGNNEGIIVTEGNKIINILDIDSIGRFVTPICVDFISEGYYGEMKNMGVNLSFVPAYTSSLTAFMTNANRLGTDNYGSTFVCNCCIPMINKQHQNEANKHGCSDVSFVSVPLKRKKVGNMSFNIPNENICDCGNRKLCYFLVNFSKRSCEFKQVRV